MTPESIREFVARPREAVRVAKLEYWAERSGSDTLQLAYALFDHARQANPGFPSDEYRRTDLDHHIHCKELVDRIARTLPVR